MAVRWLLFVVAGLGLTTAPSFAHHSFAALYDTSKPLTLRGTITRVDWTNPHVIFYMDVRDESGKVSNWSFELGSPNTLMHAGWNRNTLKPGDGITVKGSRAKDNSNQGNATTILGNDGRVLLSGENLIAR